MVAMLTYISEVFRFMRGRPDHPVYRREMTGWSYVRMWRNLRRGCLPSILILAALAAGCCGLMTLLSVSQNSSDFDGFYRVLLVVGAAVVGIFYAGEIVLLIAGLIATVLTSTSISAELEADTYALVRITLIPPREIVLAKFGAAIRELRRPVMAVLITRTLLLIMIPTLLILALVYAVSTALPAPGGGAAPPSPSSVGPVTLLPLSVMATSTLGVVSVIVAVLLGLVYYFVQPMLDMMLFAAIGIAASTMSRTRASGLFAGFGLRVALGIAACMANQVISSAVSLVLTPVLILPVTNTAVGNMLSNNPGLLVTGYALTGVVSFLLIMAGEFGGTLLLLRFSEGRAGRLPFNT